MTPLPLTFAAWEYDRLRALEDGRVKIEGVDLNFFNLRVEETFFRQLRHQEFDVSEMSLSSYVLTLNQENPPWIAMPVFPSRYFRHQSIFISKKSGIKSPADLKGKRAGCPEWQMTAPVWQRGIMKDEYGVDFSNMEWFFGAVEPSAIARPDKIKLDLPFKTTSIPQGKCLAQMLADGEIDVLFTATRPSTFETSDNVDYLFPNYKEVEKAYLKKTNIFPMMHTLVIKRSKLAEAPWLARSITKAYLESVEYAYKALDASKGALSTMLPWQADHVEETIEAFGTKRWYQDGLRENYHVLEKFLEYSYDQHLAKTKWKPEDLFALSACEQFVV